MDVSKLIEMRDQMKKKLSLRYGNKDGERKEILLCAGAACVSSGEMSIKDALLSEFKRHNLEDKVDIIETGCIGSCEMGPIAIVHPGDIFYRRLKSKDIPKIVEEHIIGGKPVERFLFKDPKTQKSVYTQKEIPFFKKQFKIALRNTGLIDPGSIEEYIGEDGYFALSKVLLDMKPEEVIETIKKSGLRGRGGAGFPTGVKWHFVKAEKSDQKYVICNGDEGDPGAFMDRSILEGDPFSILEAMTIAGYAVGANQGYIYVRAEYPLAIKRLEAAIKKAYEYGFLGKSILDTDFSFDIELRIGAGAFVCGEETALISSIEGKRGMPKPRPPYPAQKGLWGKPTLINNVETFANIPVIILKGADWFSSIGTEKSKGTKVFALAGNVKNTGLVEVPMGITLREIVYDIGGGIPRGKKFKAAQTGGPSGGCIPTKYLDIPIDYDSLKELGTIMGSGGLIILDEDTCMVGLAKFFLEFTQDESCGKCPSCRIGTKRMLEILERIEEGNGREKDIDLLLELGDSIKKGSLCGLGQTAPNPVLSTIRYFRDEYMEHIKQGRCPFKDKKNLGKADLLTTYTK